MKKYIIALLVYSPFGLIAQWEILNEGFNNDYYWSQLNVVDFVSEDVGWIGGNNGNLVKTTDGGESWNSIEVAGGINFLQIDFINDSVGWALGPNIVLRTEDGGQTWEAKFHHDSIGTYLIALYVVNQQNVFITEVTVNIYGGYPPVSKVYKTTDGGTNWVDVSPITSDRFYRSIWFLDPQNGVIVGNSSGPSQPERGIIIRTTNGGETWEEKIVTEFHSIYDLQFLDHNNGYFRAHYDTSSFICKTANMFSNWTVIKQHPYPITSYQFLDTVTVYSIMDDSLSKNNVLRSLDGGLIWSKIYTPKEGLFFNRIFFNTTTNGLITGNIMGPVLLNTTDSGFNWKIKKISYPFRDACFINQNKIFIVGGGSLGIPPHIDYAGHTFTLDEATLNINYEHDGLSGRFNKCVFFNNLEGYTLSNERFGSHIQKTLDGGNSWLFCDPPDSLYGSYNDIFFLDERNEVIVGRVCDIFTCGAAILFTTNAGSEWILDQVFPDALNYSYNLLSIYFSNSTGWSVGESGMIVKYTPQIGWVKQTSMTDLPLNKVFFRDDNHGWITGGYQNENGFQTIMLKTTNGGENWNSVPDIPYFFRDFKFIDNNLGWAIGYDNNGAGGILKSSDGGSTWKIDNDNLTSKLNAIDIKDGYALAVGDNGLILRNTNAGAVWVEEEKTNYPTEFILEQNYPNPFNPSTIIKFSIPEASKVTLSIYSLLGEELEIMVNEEQLAGNYSEEFNAANLPSGVYFYQLKAGDYISTKKMILLK